MIITEPGLYKTRDGRKAVVTEITVGYWKRRIEIEVEIGDE
jgi:hypothetical protein